MKNNFIYKCYKNINIFFRKMRFRKYRKIWRNEKITILSNYCLGGFIYNSLGMEFCSPLINTTLSDDDFIIFLEHFKEFSKVSLEQGNSDDGIIRGILRINDNIFVTILFPHDTDFSIAKEKFERRFRRVVFERILIIFRKYVPEENFYEKIDSLNFKHKMIISFKNNLGRNDTYSCKYFNFSKYPYSQELKWSSIFGRRNFDFLPYVNIIKNILKN